MENSISFGKLPPEVAQQIIGNLQGKDLLSCRLVSTYIKSQADKVIGYKNQEEDDPNLKWSPLFTTQLKCNPKENFLIQVLPGTTVVKTQKQINKFLKFAATLQPQSSNPFKNGALIYRAASRLRIPAVCSDRDLFIVFDRPVAGLTNLFRLYGHHLTSFVFDCKNQSFYQFLMPQDLSNILKHLPNLKFLGINVPLKYGLAPPAAENVDQEIIEPKKNLPRLPYLESISLGQATSAVCCRGYGDSVLALEELMESYGNQIKMLNLGESGQVTDIGDSYIHVFLEDDSFKQISFESLENLKVFSCVAPFELLQCVAACPNKKWKLKRLSLQMQRCLCKDEKDFICPLANWWRSAPNIVMALMTRFANSLEELYVDSQEREMDILHWILPSKYEWQEDKEEHQRKFEASVQTPCKQLKKLTLPANRVDTKVMGLLLARCVALEELCFLRGAGKIKVPFGNNEKGKGNLHVDYDLLLKDIWENLRTLQKITVLKDIDEQEVIYKRIRKGKRELSLSTAVTIEVVSVDSG